MSPLRVVSLLSAGLLGACMTVADRPDPPAFAETAGFSAPPPSADPEAVSDGLWWRNAVATDLSTPLERALRRNTALREAQGTVQAAQARLAQATADRGPTLSVSADVRGQKVSDGDRTDSRSLGVDGDLPLDVSGALADREDAAAQALLADTADAQQLRSDLARDFLIAVIEAAEASQRAALLDEQIDVSQTLLRLIELRFTQGLSSSVDVLQQRDELAGLRQQIPIARLDRSLAANRLRLIASRTPDEPALPLLDRLPTVQASFPTLRPVDLLDRRAALRADRARLAAADARFAAALADRLPTLGLSGGFVWRAFSGDVSSLVSAALDAAFTLFDSGNLEAIAEERRARLYAAGQAYLGGWIARVIEVDDLITEEASLRERIELSRLRLDTAEALLDAAKRRYERGVSDYLPVLAALRGLQQQQRDHLALRAALGRTRIRLHHALGNPSAAEVKA